MDTSTADPLVGSVLDGRYRIESRIARGGMATVYVARDLRLDRTVAIKVMHPHLAADEEFVRRFIGEAKAAAALSHPNVVAVYDQRTDGEHVFLVMELVHGRTLRDLLTERTRLGPREALEIMQPVLAALGAAHRAGLVHRDVKPENVLIAADGQVKVADFGLARAETAGKMTRTGLIIGTVGYLAPEQVLTGHADVRSDVYAAGVMLFELLTGRLPYEGDTPLAVAYQHANGTVPAPSEFVPGLPAPVDALVARATARDAAERPQDANAFLAAVAEVHGGLAPDFDARLAASGPRPTAVLQTPAPPGDGRTAVLDPTDGTPAGPPPRGGAFGGSGRRWAIVAVAAVAAIVLGWAVWYQFSGQYDHVPEEIIGMKPAAATKELRGHGLAVRQGDTVYSDRVDKGEVAATDPAPGARVSQGMTITLHVSKGHVPREVPDVKGRTESDARNLLESKGFRVGGVSSLPSETVAKGRAIRTKPTAGTKVSTDQPIALVMSSGMTVPDLTGWSTGDAKNALTSMGLDVKTQDRKQDGKPGGTVVGQDPAPGSGVSRGDQVTLYVTPRDCLIGNWFCNDGKGDEGNKIPVPSVIGKSFDDARRAIESSGFQMRIGTRVGDRVIGQTPIPDAQAKRGSVITVYG
ncbi:Stk1 family PASTA domain-containing Ser/Thr kinase [Actinomadura rayongensis]|uniref:non-specific serine/threonine protein kinase n=1 Tax=Actinomadura rayongensis TaxID=1429076 RepID=A0A6I4WB10_9ACTN|nr:Stk1 family PASTA domain-containing Ser/Thr kinase [Actinomadura rayongensis]MXQ63932.1 Stk1 family PASTA domain-containing Ser/Thr kinase [Actinomadura rayongensis]